jgi:hypothetical protein
VRNRYFAGPGESWRPEELPHILISDATPKVADSPSKARATSERPAIQPAQAGEDSGDRGKDGDHTSHDGGDIHGR